MIKVTKEVEAALKEGKIACVICVSDEKIFTTTLFEDPNKPSVSLNMLSALMIEVLKVGSDIIAINNPQIKEAKPDGNSNSKK